MEIREYGRKNNRSLLLLPPKYMTGRVFELIIRQLPDWHIYCVSYDGFEDARHSSYESAAVEAGKLTDRLREELPFDVVFGHGLGCSVELELPDDFARRFIFSAPSFTGTDSTQEMLKMVMPKKQLRLLQKMDDPVSQREIETVLHSVLPYTIWKEFLPEHIMDLEKSSVENVYIEDLTFYDRLEMSEEKQKRSEFWHGQRQPFPHERVAQACPQAKVISLEDYGKDDILFRAGEFQRRLEQTPLPGPASVQ